MAVSAINDWLYDSVFEVKYQRQAPTLDRIVFTLKKQQDMQVLNKKQVSEWLNSATKAGFLSETTRAGGGGSIYNLNKKQVLNIDDNDTFTEGITKCLQQIMKYGREGSAVKNLYIVLPVMFKLHSENKASGNRLTNCITECCEWAVKNGLLSKDGPLFMPKTDKDPEKPKKSQKNKNAASKKVENVVMWLDDDDDDDDDDDGVEYKPDVRGRKKARKKSKSLKSKTHASITISSGEETDGDETDSSLKPKSKKPRVTTYNCDICDFQCNSIESLFTHKFKTHRGQLQSLIQHVQNVKAKDKLVEKPNSNGKDNSDTEDDSENQSSTVEDPVYFCEICSDKPVFSSRRALDNHVDSSHLETFSSQGMQAGTNYSHKKKGKGRIKQTEHLLKSKSKVGVKRKQKSTNYMSAKKQKYSKAKGGIKCELCEQDKAKYTYYKSQTTLERHIERFHKRGAEEETEQKKSHTNKKGTNEKSTKVNGEKCGSVHKCDLCLSEYNDIKDLFIHKMQEHKKQTIDQIGEFEKTKLEEGSDSGLCSPVKLTSTNVESGISDQCDKPNTSANDLQSMLTQAVNKFCYNTGISGSEIQEKFRIEVIVHPRKDENKSEVKVKQEIIMKPDFLSKNVSNSSKAAINVESADVNSNTPQSSSQGQQQAVSTSLPSSGTDNAGPNDVTKHEQQIPVEIYQDGHRYQFESHSSSLKIVSPDDLNTLNKDSGINVSSDEGKSQENQHNLECLNHTFQTPKCNEGSLDGHLSEVDKPAVVEIKPDSTPVTPEKSECTLAAPSVCDAHNMEDLTRMKSDLENSNINQQVNELQICTVCKKKIDKETAAVPIDPETLVCSSCAGLFVSFVQHVQNFSSN